MRIFGVSSLGVGSLGVCSLMGTLMPRDRDLGKSYQPAFAPTDIRVSFGAPAPATPARIPVNAGVAGYRLSWVAARRDGP